MTIDISQYLVEEPSPAKKGRGEEIIDISQYLMEEPTTQPEGSRIPERMFKGAVRGGALIGDALSLLGVEVPTPTTPGEVERRKREFDVLSRMEQPGRVPSIGELMMLSDDGELPSYASLASGAEADRLAVQAGLPGEAKDLGEKLAENIPEFLTSALLTGGISNILGSLYKGGKLGLTMLKEAVKGIVPAAALSATDAADLPPWMQVAATYGASVASHRLTGGKGLKQVNSDLYDATKKALPSGAKTPVVGLKHKTESLIKELDKGVGAPSEVLGLEKAEKLLDKIKKGKGIMDVDELVASKKSLNEIYLKADKKTRHNLDILRDGIHDELELYGKRNPLFYELQKKADSVFKGRVESQKVENLIKNNKILSSLVGHGVLGRIIYTHSVGPEVALAGVALAGTKAVAITRALARNPGLRSVYFDFLKSATKENIKGAIKSAEMFEKQFEKKEPELYEKIVGN